MKKKRVWLYSRINHDGPESGNSLAAQQLLLESYARDHGLLVVGTSADVCGGLTFDRPGLRRFREAAEEGTVDTILIVDLSRLGHDMASVADCWLMLHGLGVSIQTVQDGAIDPKCCSLGRAICSISLYA